MYLNSSNDVLLNILVIYAQEYVWVGPIFFQKRGKCEIVHATQSENYITQLEFHLLTSRQHVPLLSIASALFEKLAWDSCCLEGWLYQLSGWLVALIPYNIWDS